MPVVFGMTFLLQSILSALPVPAKPHQKLFDWPRKISSYIKYYCRCNVISLTNILNAWPYPPETNTTPLSIIQQIPLPEQLSSIAVI